MTDNEIIKALECCIEHKCHKCPARAMFCSESIPMAFALDLITRQKAEIERLKKEVALLVENQSIPNGAEDEDWYTMPQLKSVEEVKAEAIKECLQEVVKRTKSYSCACRIRWVCDEIEKEMVGEDKVQWSKQGECPITPEQFNAIYGDEEMVGDV